MLLLSKLHCNAFYEEYYKHIKGANQSMMGIDKQNEFITALKHHDNENGESIHKLKKEYSTFDYIK